MLKEESMRIPIRRLLNSKGWFYWEDRKNSDGLVIDFVAWEIHNKEVVAHGIELEPSLARALDDPKHGFSQLDLHTCNCKWLAILQTEATLPEDVVRLFTECKKAGVGLMLVSWDKTDGRYVASGAMDPFETEGNYLDEYPSAVQELQDTLEDAVAD
jgi:hypothetical protein